MTLRTNIAGSYSISFILLPYLGYKKKQVYNEPTEDYFFLIKHIYKLINFKKHVLIHTKRVNSGVKRKKRINETIKHVNKNSQSVTTSING